MELDTLLALSPLDGRYSSKMDALRAHLSEFGLMKNRVRVEIAWLKALAAEERIKEAPAFSTPTLTALDDAAANFSLDDAAAIKSIEARTNHDVKAVEYWLKMRFQGQEEICRTSEFFHFACTSEDINNLAHALMLKDARRDCLLPELERLLSQLRDLAHTQADLPMLARTHGQAATPTTLGKEMANIAARLMRARSKFAAVPLTAKFNGAVGNYNAHLAAYPELDWADFNRRFVESFGCEFNPYTIQIEPHDALAEYCDALARVNTIVLDADRDFWQYISLGYFRQIAQAGEVGSSTMPHKVNPIDFENSEGNLGLANALLRHFAEKLPLSRMQRDLTDSTVLRNLGVALGHTLLAWNSTLRGLQRLATDAQRLEEDLAANWEVLAEAVQTVMRRYGLANPYEQLKELTRGKGVSRVALADFIRTLQIPPEAKQRLLELTPSRYIGLAARLAREI